jgi:hypothetical protein
MPKLHRICGLIIESELDLPHMPVAKAGPVALTVKLGRDLPRSHCEWFHQRLLPDGTPWMHVGRDGSDYVLRFPELADFLVSPRSATIVCDPVDGLTAHTVEHLFADQVLPLYLSCVGKTVLHASAVSLQGSAVAFIAKSGYGKSTLVASFRAEHGRLIADDCLVLDHRGDSIYCTPSYPGVRLWEDSATHLFGHAEFPVVAQYGSKLRVDGNREMPFAEGTIPVVRIYLLDASPEDGVETSISPAENLADVFVRLVESSFRLEVNDENSLADEFARLAWLLKLPIIRRLSYPRGYLELGEVRRAILQDIAADVA